MQKINLLCVVEHPYLLVYVCGRYKLQNKILDCLFILFFTQDEGPVNEVMWSRLSSQSTFEAPSTVLILRYMYFKFNIIPPTGESNVCSIVIYYIINWEKVHGMIQVNNLLVKLKLEESLAVLLCVGPKYKSEFL